MRRDRFAEKLLSLVGPADRAAAVIGDLTEETNDRGARWFWRSVMRLWLSWLGRDLLIAPLAMAVSCVVSWFVYMALSALVALVGYVVVTLGWGVAYVFTHHTGGELLAELLRIRFDWPPIPDWVTYAIQAAVMFAIAPFQIGRSSRYFWRGHEVSLAVMMLATWTAMSVFVPIVGVGISARPPMVPVMILFVLAGALFERSRNEMVALRSNKSA
jgi:hypothetical protein